MSDPKISAITHILLAHERQERNISDKLALQVQRLRLRAKMMRDKPIIIVVNTEPEGKYTLKLARLERVSRFLTTISIVGTNVCGKSVTETYKGVCSIKSV